MDNKQVTGPLKGIRVLDCATILAAPLACQILGDYGAEVIKIEHPERPDGMRGHGQSVDNKGLWWSEVARNKEAITLNLGKPEGAELFKELVKVSDVVVENFRPGTLERWGLGWETLKELNPKLILLRVTGFGQEGPYASRPAFGTLIEAMSGFAHLTGPADGPPTLPAFGLADSIAGIAAAAAVSMALFHRTQSGEGQMIDLNLLMPIMTAIGPSPAVYDKLGIIQKRQGNRSGNNAPRNLYETKDGHWLAVSTSAESIAQRVMHLVGHPEVIEEEWFSTGAGRAAHADLLDEYVGGWIAARSKDEVQEAFQEAGAAVAPVYTSQDLVEDPQVKATEMLTHVEDPDIGKVLQHNVLFNLSASPGQIRFSGRNHGENTEEVLTKLLGKSEAELAEFREQGVI